MSQTGQYCWPIQGPRQARVLLGHFALWLALYRPEISALGVGSGPKQPKSGLIGVESDVHRIAGQVTLMSPEPDATKAETCFERALTVARAQQAKSWELRASMSLARLWRDQGRVSEARELLAPVYGWFTEGFDTLDLKEAKALLEELSS